MLGLAWLWLGLRLTFVKIKFEVAKLQRYLPNLDEEQIDQITAVVAIANATEDENLIKVKQVTREEEEKFVTTNEMKEVVYCVYFCNLKRTPESQYHKFKPFC